MENIATKENGSILTPEEFNQIPEELENAISSSGQILSNSDTSQLAKAIVAYAGAGSSYDVSGTANSLILTPHNDFISPIKYYQNMIINFIPKLTNTDSVNISITGLTSVSLNDSNNQSLNANKLIVGTPYSAYFNGTNFQLIESGAAVDGSNITNDFSVNILRSKISNVIIAYKNSGITYSNNIFTVKSGFQVLIPNGKNEDNNLDSIEIYVSQDYTVSSPTTNGTYYLLMKSDKSLIWASNYSESLTVPTIDSTKKEAYYNITQNKMYYHEVNSNSWSQSLSIYLGKFTISSSIISNISLKNPIRLDSFNIAADNTVVHLAGAETITGTKTFDNDLIYKKASQDFSVIPNTPLYTEIRNVDVNNKETGQFRVWKDTDSSTHVDLLGRYQTDSVNIYGASVGVKTYPNGDSCGYCEQNTPWAWGALVTLTSQNTSTDGYVKYSNGLIIQWMLTSNITRSGTVITFPTPFTTTNYAICFNPYNSVPLNENATTVTERTASNCKVYGKVYDGGDMNCPCFVLAIGF